MRATDFDELTDQSEKNKPSYQHGYEAGHHDGLAVGMGRASAAYGKGYEAAVRDFWRAVTLRNAPKDQRSLDTALWLAGQSRDAARKARRPDDVALFERGAAAHDARAAQLRASIDERERWAKEGA